MLSLEVVKAQGETPATAEVGGKSKGTRVAVTVGIPRETKDGERRVALDPPAVATLVRRGHSVLVEHGAGDAIGHRDADFRRAGADIVPEAADVWAADIVVKVKEPQTAEYQHFRPGLQVFSYLHLAAAPQLASALARAGVTAYAFETLEDGGRLPLLAPMSEIAGRAATIIGASLLSNVGGGPGRLLGGAAGAARSRVVVIGLGVAGTMAAIGARGLGAEVIGIDVNLDVLRERRIHQAIDASRAANDTNVGEAVQDADLVIGAALVPGARAPIVLDDDHVSAMRPGSVIVDLAVDQGGCVATTRATSLSDPLYVTHDVTHYCVTNVPGQFAHTATAALAAAITPRLLALCRNPDDPQLTGARNVADGQIVHPEVRKSLEALPRDGALTT